MCARIHTHTHLLYLKQVHMLVIALRDHDYISAGIKLVAYTMINLVSKSLLLFCCCCGNEIRVSFKRIK